MSALNITEIEHRDGVVWTDAPEPFRLHCHRWQTRAIIDGKVTERCACGAFSDGMGNWIFLHPDKARVWP